jgi:hypothetical protein
VFWAQRVLVQSHCPTFGSFGTRDPEMTFANLSIRSVADARAFARIARCLVVTGGCLKSRTCQPILRKGKLACIKGALRSLSYFGEFSCIRMNNLRRSNSCAVRALRSPGKKWNIGWQKPRNGNKSENSLSRSYKEGLHRTPATAGQIKAAVRINQDSSHGSSTSDFKSRNSSR